MIKEDISTTNTGCQELEKQHADVKEEILKTNTRVQNLEQKYADTCNNEEVSKTNTRFQKLEQQHADVKEVIAKANQREIDFHNPVVEPSQVNVLFPFQNLLYKGTKMYNLYKSYKACTIIVIIFIHVYIEKREY